MKYNKYAVKRARAHTSRSRFRLSRGPYALFARFIAVRAAGRVCKSPRFYNRALFRTVSSLSCFHGARRNIRQCRGVLAKLSVALGRLRFTRSCLASPRPTSSHLASPAVCVFARNVDTSTCPRRRSPRPGSASVLTERPRENWKEGNARREHRARRSGRERERERMTET